MKGIFCKLSTSNTRKLANKYSVPESIVRTIEQAVSSEEHQEGTTSEQLVEQRIQQWLDRLNNPTAIQSKDIPYYTGNITPSENTIFVFGSNPEGKHGAGAAKVAVNQFGAIYGQGEGIQGQAYALPTKRIETHITPKLKGSMTYSFNGRQRSDITSSETIEAIINGERTATTRYESDGNIDYWSQAKVGDIVEFHKNKTKVFVRITKSLTKLDPETNAEEWSKKEGWSIDHFNKEVKPKIDAGIAYQMEYEYVGAYGERTMTPAEIKQGISKLYEVAKANPTKQFKIGYRNKENEITLNGYSGREMMIFFTDHEEIPFNVVFSSEWTMTPFFKNSYFKELSTSEEIAKTTSQLFYKRNHRIDPSVKEYRYKMVARDFAIKSSSALNDAIYALENEIDNEISESLKHKKVALLQKLKEDKGLHYFISNYPGAINNIFQQVKEEYQMYANTGEDMLDDEDVLDAFPTKNPDGANYVRTQLSLLVDNFNMVAEGALVDIENILGIRVTLNPQITIEGEINLTASTVEDENETNDIDIVNEDEPQDYSG